jgi:tRNA-modifying protein YgfZ
MSIILDQPLVIEVSGPDAGKILHNLTTNHIQSIKVAESMESFVTDVRGWTVAHGLVYRADQDRWLLVGQHPNSATVCSHVDRYIIREKAAVKDLSASSSVELQTTISVGLDEMPGSVDTVEHSTAAQHSAAAVGVASFNVPFPAVGQSACLVVQADRSPVNSPDLTTLRTWEQLRIAHFWPRMGVDIWEKCIPQEIDRDETAISFTKGCYLGQETIARLDARGQIQKKLCLLLLDGPASVASKLLFNDQEVGHLTSVAPFQDRSLALGVIRRGHFAVDTRLSSQGVSAQVIDSAKAVILLNNGE